MEPQLEADAVAATNLATAPDSAADPIPPTKRPGRIVRLVQALGRMLDWLFGAATMVVTLAVCAVIPGLNFLSLGYLLEVSRRVARGRLRDGFIGVREAAVLGRIIIGTWLVFLPVRFVSGLWQDAQLIAPGGNQAFALRVLLVGLTFATVWHVIWACLRGGQLRHFAWPAPVRFVKWLFTPGKELAVRRVVTEYVAGLRLPYFFWLGARGFAGAAAWLLVPVVILLAASRLHPVVAGLISLIGSVLLLVVVMYLPFLQARFACENRFGAMFELRAVRQLFRQAPLAFWSALLITLLFAVPLYLLKVEFPPKELVWLPSLLFVLFIIPARLLTGWAMGRALRHEQPRHFLLRWAARLAAIPVAAGYVFIVYFTQYLSWNGAFSLLEQHAFLVPAPMMSL